MEGTEFSGCPGRSFFFTQLCVNPWKAYSDTFVYNRRKNTCVLGATISNVGKWIQINSTVFKLEYFRWCYYEMMSSGKPEVYARCTINARRRTWWRVNASVEVAAGRGCFTAWCARLYALVRLASTRTENGTRIRPRTLRATRAYAHADNERSEKWKQYIHEQRD